MNKLQAAIATAILTLIAFIHTSLLVIKAQPDCSRRVEWVFLAANVCLETVIELPRVPGIITIAGLAFAPDGTIYFTSPATNAIWQAKLDNDGYFGDPHVFAADLPEPPFGIAYDEMSASWFVSADSMIYRLRDTDSDRTADEITILVRDLPGGAGGWLGDIRIGAERRLYVAKAATCDDCVETDPRRAALLSFALDGSDERIVASGLNDAFSFDWTPTGLLFIIDNTSLSQPAELNVLPPRAPHINFQVTPPILTFDAGSHPTGVLYYQGTHFQDQRRGLFIVFAGSWNNTAVTGHELIFIHLAESDQVTGVERLIPESPRSTSDASLIKTTLHPYRPYDLVLGSDGWLYIAIAEGRIYRLRVL